MRELVWFRRDLRIQDNPALTAAVEECEDVVPLFVFDEPLLRAQLFGSACVNFMLQSLHELSITLSELGLELTWRRGEPLDPLAVRPPAFVAPPFIFKRVPGVISLF
jgi:deoxyribodipyrimidine photo-lyase